MVTMYTSLSITKYHHSNNKNEITIYKFSYVQEFLQSWRCRFIGNVLFGGTIDRTQMTLILILKWQRSLYIGIRYRRLVSVTVVPKEQQKQKKETVVPNNSRNKRKSIVGESVRQRPRVHKKEFMIINLNRNTRNLNHNSVTLNDNFL